MKNGLVEITKDIYVRRSDVLAVTLRFGYLATIWLKHNVTVEVPTLTPKEVMDKLNEIEE